jgi:hypothetical protein
MWSNHPPIVMPALVAGIHVFFLSFSEQGVDGRDKPGHDSQQVLEGARRYALKNPTKRS